MRALDFCVKHNTVNFAVVNAEVNKLCRYAVGFCGYVCVFKATGIGNYSRVKAPL